LHFDRRLLRVAWPSNVVGILPGTDPWLHDEYIVYTAHYDGLGLNPYGPPTRDSILNGADDNASGTAALLQIARALANARPALKRSVVFVATSGEERGLWGSDYFVSHFPAGNGRIVANINLDMIGRARGDTVYIAGDAVPAARDVITSASARSGGLTILDERALDRRWPNERLGLRSDHYYFMQRGIPVAVLFTGLHNDYHRPTDESETLNYDVMSRITRVAMEIGRHLAERGAPRAAPRR
jgi:Zn-dependent M28 family amino/carboxypeptidase